MLLIRACPRIDRNDSSAASDDNDDDTNDNNMNDRNSLLQVSHCGYITYCYISKRTPAQVSVARDCYPAYYWQTLNTLRFDA